jgi:LacI family transcriptional regulator
MSATIRDIAKVARVSATTVSLVLNGKRGISAETRERVLSVASNLKYSAREPRSQRLVRSRTLRFLKIAKHGHTVNRDHNTFISDYIDGMSQESVRRGYKLEVVSFEGKPISEIVDSLPTNSLAGVVVLGTELSGDDIQLFQGVTSAIVFIDTFYDKIDANFVDMNNKDAVNKIIAYLMKQGFKNIGLISSNVETINFKLRAEAFLECMKERGLTVSPSDIVTVDSTYDGAYQGMVEWLRKDPRLPECYFCTNDVITYGCIKALREFNLEIPRDVSIVGFDNLPMSSAMTPPLTTIDVSKKRIGYLAISVLDDLVLSSEPWPFVKILVGAQLIVRDSVAAKRT